MPFGKQIGDTLSIEHIQKDQYLIFGRRVLEGSEARRHQFMKTGTTTSGVGDRSTTAVISRGGGHCQVELKHSDSPDVQHALFPLLLQLPIHELDDFALVAFNGKFASCYVFKIRQLWTDLKMLPKAVLRESALCHLRRSWLMGNRRSRDRNRRTHRIFAYARHPPTETFWPDMHHHIPLK